MATSLPAARLAATALAVAACSAAPGPGIEPLAGPASGPVLAGPGSAGPESAGPTAVLPPGVLARAQGVNGVVSVVERDGMRYLLIDDTVQAAVPADGARSGPDPIVALIRAARPAARRVLVIGLGSGKTASDLQTAGLQVTAVEIEPAVIDYARRFFGYRGQAIAADGLAYLESTDDSHDVILVDAFSGAEPPRQLVDARAFRTMRKRLRPSGAIVVRGLGEPSDPALVAMFQALTGSISDRVPYPLLLGSGVGDEQQNLYLLASARPINLIAVKDLPMWPLRIGRGGPVSPGAVNRDDEPGAGPAAIGRAIRARGYLIRLTENGALALDMPHWEMGALRYLLTGPGARELEARIPSQAVFPTSGEIGSDGDTRKTLRPLLGGGGVMRSDVRFSTVVVEVEGTATLRSVVDPDAAPFVPRSLRGDAPTDKLLPYGGALYDLEVDRVSWVFDVAGWNQTRRILGPSLRAAVKALGRDDLAGAAARIDDYLGKLPSGLPRTIPAMAKMAQLRDGIRTEAAALAGKQEAGKLAVGKPTRFRRAIACDRAAEVSQLSSYDNFAADALAIQTALLRCAERNYRAVASQPRSPHARAATGRLLHLLDLRLFDGSPAAERAVEREMKTLRARYPEVDELREIPPVPG